MTTRAYVAEGTKMASVSEMREKCSPTDCLARMILGEAGNQPENEMIAIAYVVQERLQFPEQFGADIKSVVLQNDGGQFGGVKSSYALNPKTHSAWPKCLEVAKNYLNEENPIGHCLWFNTNDVFNKNLKENGGKYKFAGTTTAKEVVRSVCLGNAHTFFCVEGYDF